MVGPRTYWENAAPSRQHSFLAKLKSRGRVSHPPYRNCWRCEVCEKSFCGCGKNEGGSLFRIGGGYALQYSKAHKLSYDYDAYRMAKRQKAFGNRSAEGIYASGTRAVDRRSRGLDSATANRYRAFLSLTYGPAGLNRQGYSEPERLIRHRREDNARLRWLSPGDGKNLRKAIEERDRSTWTGPLG